MVTFYKRACPSQKMVLRIVEGAVKNASDAHPEIEISPQHRRSIAKRAAGTLTAQWPDVLAAREPSESDGVLSGSKTHRRSSQLVPATGREASHDHQRFPLRRLISMISRPIRGLKESGQDERAEAFVDVLKMIHEITHEKKK